ncbi:carbohydrate-binding module family 1 protein [Sodiomyces alcalophilus JCM 7366]|uniref:carbohydrate-binding module family 1 protein n=1 Tax=Sodiomyces alcalophilus JCM 7366 TaxID=591952 RepID=UPI0039B4C485
MRYTGVSALLLVAGGLLSGVALGAPSLEERQSCSSLWGQCAGNGWSGPTCCESGSTCTYQNDWYSQCLPGSSPPPPPPPPPPPTTPPPPPPPPSSTTTSAVDDCPTPRPRARRRAPSAYGVPSSPDRTRLCIAEPLGPFHLPQRRQGQLGRYVECRQREVSALMQQYELGHLPPPPQSVSASYCGNTLSIIALGGASIPVPNGAATITFNNNEIADHSAGAMTAWAWAVSRIIDALGSLDSFGFSQVGGHQHCSFNIGKQGTELSAFISKFLLKSGGGATDILRTERNHGSFNLGDFAPWAVPNLS